MQELFRYIDSCSQKFIDELVKLCSQPSVSAQNMGIMECAQLVKSMLEQRGLNAKIFRPEKGSPIIYAELSTDPGKKTILFYDHYDVQPPEPLEEWNSEPFTPTITNGKMFARGVADNKANLAARIMAVEAASSVMRNVPVNIKFIVEGEEEIGSPNLPEFIRKSKSLLSADGCLWEGGKIHSDDRPEIYLGMKGILYVELSVETAKVDQHSMWAPIVPNPGWEMVWALNSLKDRKQRIAVEGFYDGMNTSPEDLELLDRIPLDEDELKSMFGIDSFLQDLTGLELRRALYFGPTCTICGLDSGYTGSGSKTVNPRIARAKIDFRLVPEQRPDDIMRKLIKHFEKIGFGNVKVTRLGSFEPAKTSRSSRIVNQLLDTARIVYGNDPIIVPMVPGSGPMSYFTNELGLPVASGECITTQDSRYHAPNENISLRNYINGIKHVAALITRYD